MIDKMDETALYIHIPFCRTKCGYCGFYSEPIANHDSEKVISAILREMSRYDLGDTVRTVYIGGGSPSCLPAEQLLRLVEQCPTAEEFTIEVNPGQISENILSQLHKTGVNRLSIGAQSFNQNELAFLGRGHSVNDIGRAVQAAGAAGFENMSLDLIFAVPPSTSLGAGGSTIESWRHSLKSAVDLDVRHISAYSLTYEERTPLQKAVEAGKVVPVDEETDRAMYETAIDELKKAGFAQYEISNFAKSGFECRHNLVYWANRPYVGIGPAAASYWDGKRSSNVADVEKYTEMIERGDSAVAESETPSVLEIACETAVLNLRRRNGIDLAEFKAHTGFDATELFAEPIERYKKIGLIDNAGGRVFLTRKALAIADSVLCDFAAL
jgi:oxygen-independent coproporphyrinogen-3 oxidase